MFLEIVGSGLWAAYEKDCFACNDEKDACYDDNKCHRRIEATKTTFFPNVFAEISGRNFCKENI